MTETINNHTPTAPESLTLNTEANQQNLIPLEVIRIENVISKFPVHNLAKTGRVNINLSRKREDGEIELHWEVTYNEKYGEAKQLAYQIDTLIIAKRIYELFEAGQTLPQVFPIGSLYQICQELGMNPQSGKNKNNIKRALGQNAGAFIDAKVSYKDRAGEERRLNAQFSRYAVVHRDQKLPDGRRADQVYIVLQPIYHEVLTNARWRPINFSYLKELPPASQRCYEIISPRLFAALKYGHHFAEMAYSDYCAYSAQIRQHNYKAFRAQMDHVHKPHLVSGYLARVEYKQTIDSAGLVDWIIAYYPGERARAEFNYFNPRWEGKRQLERQVKLDSKKLSAGREATQGETMAAAEALVRHFHALVHKDRADYTPLKRELEQAAQLLGRHGRELARQIVEFACREAPKTKFEMQVFGATLVFEQRALQHFARRQVEHSGAADLGQGSEPSSASVIGEQAALAEARYQNLTAAELEAYRARVEAEIRTRVGDRFEWLWDETVREATVKANILKMLGEDLAW
jgi:hypothetical protein